MSILDLLEEEAPKYDKAQIQAVYIKVGELSGVVAEALSSAYELAREQTAFEHCRLVIEPTQGAELSVSALELDS